MSDSTPECISVKAPKKTKVEETLEESFYKDLAGQAERLDKFALELIKLQLAIPAIYVGILKLLEGTRKHGQSTRLRRWFSRLEETSRLTATTQPVLSPVLTFRSPYEQRESAKKH